MTKRTLLFLAALAVTPSLTASPQRPLIVVSQDHSMIDDCEHFHTQNVTTFPAEAHAQEQKALSLRGQTVKVKASQAGGISILGWDRPDAVLTVCKYAVGISHPQVERLLAGISISAANGEVSPTGPAINATQMWWVHFILNVPRRSLLELLSENGGIAVRNISGSVIAHALNGGISLAQCNGVHRVETRNGGISLDRVFGRTEAKSQSGGISLTGGSGEVSLSTDSGEISIRLSGDLWTGAGVNARTQKGDVTLRIRDGYAARIEADTAGPGEIICHLRSCTNTPKQKHLLLGSASPLIHLTTTSSPITIEELR